MSNVLQAPAFWGLLGAFWYAGPHLVACLFDAEENPEHRIAACLTRFVVAMLIGASGAAAVAPWIIELRHGGLREANAIAAGIGMMANNAAPVLIQFAPKLAQRVLAAFMEMKDEPRSRG